MYPAAAAVAWVLAHGVTAAICGGRRPAQLDDWLTAGHLLLDDQLVQRLKSLGGAEPAEF